jgi:hypothetical protein
VKFGKFAENNIPNQKPPPFAPAAIVESNDTAVAPVPHNHVVAAPPTALFAIIVNVPIAVEFAPGNPIERIVMSALAMK